MNFLGIDPGYGRLGYGIITINKSSKKPVYFDCGVIVTDLKLEDGERLLSLEEQLKLIIRKVRINFCAVEEVFFRKNLTTGVKLIQARGVILLNLAKEKIPLTQVSPTTVKKLVTGYGASNKKQMQQMIKIILNLKALPQPDDAADGLALAIAAWLYFKSKNVNII